jgi:hypothetical protein
MTGAALYPPVENTTSILAAWSAFLAWAVARKSLTADHHPFGVFSE